MTNTNNLLTLIKNLFKSCLLIGEGEAMPKFRVNPLDYYILSHLISNLVDLSAFNTIKRNFVMNNLLDTTYFLHLMSILVVLYGHISQLMVQLESFCKRLKIHHYYIT